MKLYLLVSNSGDGSYAIYKVLDEKVIKKLQEAYDADKIDYEYGPGIDGDGFHYSTINVPDGSTAESLGINLFTMEKVDELLSGDE